MKKRSIVYWIIALPIIALCLHPQSVSAEEKKPRWLLSVTTQAGTSIAVVETEAECDSAMVAVGDVLTAVGSSGVVACSELKPVPKIPEGLSEAPKKPALKKERDS